MYASEPSDQRQSFTSGASRVDAPLRIVMPFLEKNSVFVDLNHLLERVPIASTDGGTVIAESQWRWWTNMSRKEHSRHGTPRKYTWCYRLSPRRSIQLSSHNTRRWRVQTLSDRCLHHGALFHPAYTARLRFEMYSQAHDKVRV